MIKVLQLTRFNQPIIFIMQRKFSNQQDLELFGYHYTAPHISDWMKRLSFPDYVADKDAFGAERASSRATKVSRFTAMLLGSKGAAKDRTLWINCGQASTISNTWPRVEVLSESWLHLGTGYDRLFDSCFDTVPFYFFHISIVMHILNLYQ